MNNEVGILADTSEGNLARKVHNLVCMLGIQARNVVLGSKDHSLVRMEHSLVVDSMAVHTVADNRDRTLVDIGIHKDRSSHPTIYCNLLS